MWRPTTTRTMVLRALIMAFFMTGATSLECHSQNVPSECRALSDIKAALCSNEQVKAASICTSWAFNGSNLCNWDGVLCNKDSRVRQLDLHDHGLAGPVPGKELAELPHLTRLYMSQNQLSGSLPEVLATIKDLKYIDFSHNEITGTLPAAFGDMPNLMWLYLKVNQMTGTIPAAIAKATKLVNLSLQYNKFSGSVPTALATLPELSHLSLQHNELTTVPDDPSLCEMAERLPDRHCNLNENHWDCHALPKCILEDSGCATGCAENKDGKLVTDKVRRLGLHEGHTGGKAAGDHSEL